MTVADDVTAGAIVLIAFLCAFVARYFVALNTWRDHGTGVFVRCAPSPSLFALTCTIAVARAFARVASVGRKLENWLLGIAFRASQRRYRSSLLAVDVACAAKAGNVETTRRLLALARDRAEELAIIGDVTRAGGVEFLQAVTSKARRQTATTLE